MMLNESSDHSFNRLLALSSLTVLVSVDTLAALLTNHTAVTQRTPRAPLPPVGSLSQQTLS
jgi:hypothetical protein